MATNKTLISVLIPAYNHDKYIQETIKSIINQTYQNLELIIIDDGSKDSTWQKILDIKPLCEERFSHVAVYTQENQGTINTLNRLLNLSNGKYLYIIASDDIAKPAAIEKEYDFLSKNPDYALCVGDSEIIDSNSEICYLKEDMSPVKDKEKASFKTFGKYLQAGAKISFQSEKFGTYNKLLCGNHVPNGYLVRKSIFDKIGLFTKNAPLEDYWMMLQISKYAKMKYLDEILFSYRIHGANTMANREKMIDMTNQTKENEWDVLENIKLEETLPIVKKIQKAGFCFKRQGIPFVCEILTYKKRDIRRKELWIFGIKILQITKIRKS